ncbi:unnamed protein product, partial [Urochloa humidicola]
SLDSFLVPPDHPLRLRPPGGRSDAARAGEIGGVQGRIGASKMFDDQDLGFFTNFVGVFIFVLITAYHYVMADPKFEGN